MEQVRLPRSATRRGACTYLKLLRRARPDPVWGGFEYEGQFLRPGAVVDEGELWPGPEWPEMPVLLECAGEDGSGWGHQRSPSTYILWVWESGEWREVARAASVGREWTWDLEQAARRALGQGKRRPPEIDPAAVRERVARVLEAELEGLDQAGQAEVLSAVHDELAARIVGERAWRAAA